MWLDQVEAAGRGRWVGFFFLVAGPGRHARVAEPEKLGEVADTPRQKARCGGGGVCVVTSRKTA